MFGSMTVKSTAKRGGVSVADEKILVSPSDYNVTTGNIKKRQETVAPFDTSQKRNMFYYEFKPGPAAYFPKPQKISNGGPVMRPDYYPAQFRLGARTPGPGPAYKPLDHFTKIAQEARMMATKRPRVNFDKFVSNSCPTIYHPRDVRCFVEGVDGRMYPWRIN